jgi:hypothetical protein
VRPRGGVVPVALLVAACTGLAVSACSGGDGRSSAPATTDAPTTRTTRTPVAVAPLTGLPDPKGIASTRPALGVKIENTPDARPQTGLEQADIVYEEVVEGGITRFWAFFNSAAPGTVGPIRSVRSMDPNIILPFGGIVAFSGGTAPNVALVRATGLVTVDEGNAGPAFFREPSRAAPHNLYGRTALLWGFGGTPVPPPPMFVYARSRTPASGEPVAFFHVGLQAGYDVTYVWDETRRAWARFTDGGEPFMAAGPRPVQVAPTNVIVQLIPYGHGADGDVMGSGEAWVFTNGRLIRATWGKAFAPAATQFVDAAGNPIALTPGPTWVELAPVGTAVDVIPGVGAGTATTAAPPLHPRDGEAPTSTTRLRSAKERASVH